MQSLAPPLPSTVFGPITPPDSLHSPSPRTSPLLGPGTLPLANDVPTSTPSRPRPMSTTATFNSFPRHPQTGDDPTNPMPSPQTIKPGGVAFPATIPDPSNDLNPSLDEPRIRVHSTLTKPSLTRSQTMSFGNKLKSLRKKIESELSRKRTIGSNQGGQTIGGSQGRRGGKKPQTGTVAGLRPSPALTVPESMSVADASQLCAAKRTDCVLVVDEEEGLSGIFTAKDLAFRVTADGLDPRTTTVAQIMTKNPMVTRDTTSATDALQLMVSRHFRHLPVCNEEGDVVGLLDITKVFHEALAKVERGSTATSQLSAALAGVQTELGPGLAGNPQAAAMMAYVDALRDRMALPDLTSVLDTSNSPPTVSPRTSVREAAKLMKERRTTAVCVMETNTTSTSQVSNSGSGIPKIAGIFTSKDIVLRVIAAGLDASRCSVVRVMTPHPDTAPPTMVVQDALKKMHNGHYLNLPVVEADGRLIGIVDVLKLTYATLEQIDSMSEDKQANDGGPMWSKFFDTLNTAGPDDDATSVTSHSERPDTPSKPSMHRRGLSSMTSPTSELQPNDSASAVDDNSESGRPAHASSVAPQSILPIDDGTYVFKFRTPSDRTHRFQARHDSYELLRDIVAGKLAADPFFSNDSVPEGTSMHIPDPNAFTLSYTDDEGDLVTMTADGDVLDAVRVARNQKADRVVLLVDGGKAWEEAARDQGGENAVQRLQEAEHEVKGVEAEEDKMESTSADPATQPTFGAKGIVHSHGPSRGTPGGPPELVLGFLPKEMALPAAIGFLGVVIIGVFVATKATKQT